MSGPNYVPAFAAPLCVGDTDIRSTSAAVMSNESSLPHLVDQAEESLEEARFNEMRNVPSSAQSDAQENLDQASMAVNDALRRLQDLRTSIAGLSGRTQNETTAHVPNPSIGPSHSAILLSDAASDDVPDSEAVPEMGRLRSTIPSAIMDRLEEFEATTHQRLANLGSVGSSSATHRPQNLDSTGRSVVGPSSRPHHVFREPPLPDLVLPPRRSWLEPSLSRRRDIEDDDASTGLGRRVAARIAADTHSSSPQVTNGTTDTSRASLRHAVSRVENSRVSTAGLEPVAVARRFHDRQAAPRPRSSTAAREAELVRRLEEARAISLRARNIISSSQSGDSSRAGTAENATMRRWHFGEVSGSGENRYSIPEDPDSISWWNSINIATNTGSSSGRPQDQPNVLPMNPGNPSPEPRTFEETARYLRRRRQDAEEGEQLRARSGDRDQGEEWSTRLLSRSTEQGRSPPGWTETSARWNSLNPLQSRSERQPPPQLTMDAYLEAYQASAPNAPRRRRGWGKCLALSVFY